MQQHITYSAPAASPEQLELWRLNRARGLQQTLELEQRRDAWAARENVRRGARGCRGVYRLTGLRRYRHVDLPGLDWYFHRDHLDCWLRGGRVVVVTAHIYGWTAAHHVVALRAVEPYGITVEVIPPPAGWYGFNTTMLVYRRADGGGR